MSIQDARCVPYCNAPATNKTSPKHKWNLHLAKGGVHIRTTHKSWQDISVLQVTKSVNFGVYVVYGPSQTINTAFPRQFDMEIVKEQLARPISSRIRACVTSQGYYIR